MELWFQYFRFNDFNLWLINSRCYLANFSHATVNFGKSSSQECLKIIQSNWKGSRWKYNMISSISFRGQASILELNLSGSFDLWPYDYCILKFPELRRSWLLSISGGKGTDRITTRHYQIQCQFEINAEINVRLLVWNLTSF